MEWEQLRERFFNLSLKKKALFIQEIGYDLFACEVKSKTPIEKLIAYVSLAQNEVTAETLSNFLKEKLPYYMIPSEFIFMEGEIPLTINGKVDLRALPLPTSYIGNSYKEIVYPRNELEEKVVKIWTEVLQREKISIHENFFEIGGHSLLATQIIARIQKEFSKNITVKAIFENPTIAELAELINISDSSIAQEVNLAETLEELEDEILLSFSQEPFWIIDQLGFSHHLYHMPGIVRIEGRIDLSMMEEALNFIIQRHEILRTAFIVNKQGEGCQKILKKIDIVIPLVDMTAYDLEEAKVKTWNYCLQEAQKPFILGEPPLFRIQIYKLAETEYWLALTLHHIISDGWSIKLLTQEFFSIYSMLSQRKLPVLAKLPMQYKEYAMKQRKTLQGNVLEEKIAHWKSLLLGAPSPFPQLTDKLRPSIRTYQGAIWLQLYPSELKRTINNFCKEKSITLFTVLLTAFQLLLRFHSGQKDILIGSPFANRKTLPEEKMIGCFINTVVLRSRFSDNFTIEQTLYNVQAANLMAYEHADLPFEKLLSALKIERHPAFSPLFNIMFVLQNADEGSATFTCGDLNISPLEFHTGTAKFDITLSINETADGLFGQYEYNTDLFHEETIARLASQLQQILIAMMKKPEQMLSDLLLAFEAKLTRLSYSPSITYLDGAL